MIQVKNVAVFSPAVDSQAAGSGKDSSILFQMGIESDRQQLVLARKKRIIFRHPQNHHTHHPQF